MANGGIIGPVNLTSRGKNTQTVKTSSTPSITTQPGTRLVNTLIVAGGGGAGGGASRAGGGGAGGARNLSNLPTGAGNIGAVTVGAGGAGGSPEVVGTKGCNTTIVINCTTYSTTGGGGGGGGGQPDDDGLGAAGGSGGGPGSNVINRAGDLVTKLVLIYQKEIQVEQET